MAAVRAPASGWSVPTQTRITPSVSSSRPKRRTAPGFRMPAGMGRLRVRSILASASLSHHMLMAPQPPAARAVPIASETSTLGLVAWLGALQK